MSTSNHWQAVLSSIVQSHPHLDSLRVYRENGASGIQAESLPDFIKIAVAIAAQSCDSPKSRPLRLAIVAPRWSDGAFWTAVGATLCFLRRDFENARNRLPEFKIGDKLLLDREKIVQFDGEDAEHLHLIDAEGRLSVRHSRRMRLQPTESKRPLSRVAWPGDPPPDLLDELLQIQSQGARHIFTPRVALVAGKTGSLNIARHVSATLRSQGLLVPLSPGSRAEVTTRIRRVKGHLARHIKETDRLWRLITLAETQATAPEMTQRERREFAGNLAEIVNLMESHRDSEVHQKRKELENVLRIVQPQQESNAPPQELHDLFQWGALTETGDCEIVSPGQVAAPAVLLLSHELLALRAFLRRQKPDETRPLVVLDGASSFRNRLIDLRQILDCGAPVLACIERGQSEDAAQLKESGFEIWKWLPDDLHPLSDLDPSQVAPLFGSLLRAHRNYARHKLRERVCHCEHIDAASQTLMELLDDLDPQSSETKTLEGALYGSLLLIARQLNRLPQSNEEARAQIAQARGEISRHLMWLDETTQTRAEYVLKHLAAAIGVEGGGKSDGLLELLAASTAQNIVVVVAGAQHVKAARESWKTVRKASGTEEDLRQKTVSFCCLATAESHLAETRAEHLILCGWLGAHRMRRLLDGCLAADISILLYPFERGWLRGALRRWRGSEENLNATRRLALMGISHADLKLSDNAREPLSELMDAMPPNEQRASEFDAGQYEERLRVHRRASLAAGAPGEATEPARLFEFSSDHFAFLTESCRHPVVNELIAQARDPDASSSKASKRAKELPQKRADELAVGDYVVFRQGAAGDLIRDMADIVLRRQNSEHLRDVAGLWKVALQEWAQREQELALDWGKRGGLKNIMAALKEHGVERGEQTILKWLDPDHQTIGPRDPEKTFAAIARVTGDEEFARQLPAVLQALERVYSAHFGASDILKSTLYERLPAFLAQTDEDSFAQGLLQIDIPNVGEAVVVRVEEIGRETIKVSRSQINVLQSEVATAAPSLFEMND